MNNNTEERYRIYYPFTAIVGNEDAKLALILNAIDPDIGGVLLVGDKGTGKSTMVRSLAQVLPEIEVVADCPFNDDPNDPTHMCDICYSRYVRGEQLPVVRRKMRVVNLPLSITVDRLVGTIDIKRALKEGIRALQPGLLAEANRNILYIDEVNLLDDYIANLLLDVAASGWNIIEREGLSFKHPAKFVLVGSMNPEEGELRPQLLDRFGLYVRVEASRDPEERVEIVRRVEEFRRDPISFYRKFEPLEEELRRRVEGARALLRDVEIDDDLLRLIAKTITEMGIKTHRAEIVVVRAAKALAAFNGRRRVELEDVKKAMELALPHRVRARPFNESSNYDSFRNALHNLLEGKRPSDSTSNGSDASRPQPFGGSSYNNINNAMDGTSHGSLGLNSLRSPSHRYSIDEVRIQGDYRNVLIRDIIKDIMGRGSRGVRRYVIGHRGVPIGYVLPRGPDDVQDIDIFATINTAVLRRPYLPLNIEPEDYRIRLRVADSPSLIIILLDLSGSMAAMRRISIAKGIVRRIIEGSYVRRSLLSVITFKGVNAEILLRPTRAYETAYKMINELSVGGTTPLPAALAKLLDIAKDLKIKSGRVSVTAVLVTDGKANVPIRRSVIEDLHELCTAIKRAGIRVVVYPTEVNAFDPAPTYIGHLINWCGAEVKSYELGNP